MPMNQTSKILPFVPVDSVRVNRDLNQEIVERERADVLADMADETIEALDMGRVIKGDIEP